MTTKRTVANVFGTALHQVEQIGSKQLYIVRKSSGSYLVSYTTIVGKFIFADDLHNNKWHLTAHKYSVTTSKQMTQFKRLYPNHVVVDAIITESYGEAK